MPRFTCYFDGVDLAENGRDQRLAADNPTSRLEGIHPDHQAPLAVALVAPVEDRPVVRFLAAEREWEDGPVRVQ